MKNLTVNVGDWVVDKNGEVHQILNHEMPDLPYENITRHADKSDFDPKDIPSEFLEKRMYFLVPYNISPIQQAIQAGHAMGEYALEFGRYNPDHIIWEFLEKWKTWIVLNGGTTNNSFNLNGVARGTLNQTVQDLLEFNSANPDSKIDFSTFQEPHLNDALTAVCLIVDERVFNRENYPDFSVWADNKSEEINYYNWGYDKQLSKYFTDVDIDNKIHFLKELLNNKKLA